MLQFHSETGLQFHCYPSTEYFHNSRTLLVTWNSVSPGTLLTVRKYNCVTPLELLPIYVLQIGIIRFIRPDQKFARSNAEIAVN